MNCTQSLDSHPNPTEDGWSRCVLQPLQITDCYPGERKCTPKTQLQCCVNSRLLTPWNRILLRSWCALGEKIHHLSQNTRLQDPLNISWHTWIWPTLLEHVSLRYVLILSSHLSLVSQVVSSFQIILLKLYMHSSSLSYMLYTVLISPSLIWQR
jgi:hypothetical protein